MLVVITEIIPFNKIDEQTLSEWKEEVEECYWLYAKETDYFIKGILSIRDAKREDIIFVRTLDDAWFSLGYWGGILDVDGSLRKIY